MKVLHLSKFHPPVHGGIESTVALLAEALHADGHEVCVLCANTSAETRRDQSAAGYPVVRAGSWGSLLSMSVAPSLLGELRLALQSTELVHVHMPDPMAALALWAARTQLGRRALVLHWHSDVVRQRVARHLYRPLQDWLLGRADAVIATSEPYADSSADLAPWRSKVHVIPIGIGDNAPQVNAERVRILRAAGGGRARVFALGRFVGYKGFDVLIDAVPRLAADALVCIGGGGGDPRVRHGLERRIEALGLGLRVQLLGRIDDHDLANHFAACDVFCMPSLDRSEAFGIAQVEAMCMGRPVVSSAVPGSGVTWINRHEQTGLTVPPGDPGALAAALNRLLGDAPLRERLGRAARQHWSQSLQRDHMVARMDTLYAALRRPVQTSQGMPA
jgi:glycosyltransferase involved in cell wall biosynthesis